MKRLGDGLMAVFDEPAAAVHAALEAAAGLDGIEVGRAQPALAGRLHVGPPAQGRAATTWAWT